MPTPMVKEFAKESGKSVKSVEKLWKQAKKKVAEQYPKISEKNPRFWKLTTSILKKMIKLDESVSNFDLLSSEYLTEENKEI
jgi:hypothetical protein